MERIAESTVIAIIILVILMMCILPTMHVKKWIHDIKFKIKRSRGP